MAPKAADLKPGNEKPSAAELGQFVASLAKHGIVGQALVTAIGLSKDNTRRQNADKLKVWFRSRPKA